MAEGNNAALERPFREIIPLRRDVGISPERVQEYLALEERFPGLYGVFQHLLTDLLPLTLEELQKREKEQRNLTEKKLCRSEYSKPS